MSPHILLLGVNHTTAPVALREQLAINGTRLTEALNRFGSPNGHGPTLLPEGVILSTCNRLEIYTLAGDADPGRDTLIQFLSQSQEIPVDEFADALYSKSDSDAAAHLTRVACGLDSMVVGEPQILGQVTDAYRTSLSRQATRRSIPRRDP